MVDRGQSLTVDAMSQPKMSEMVPSDPKYNPAVEARQRFHFFEEELRKAQPLNPESWRRIQKAHVDDYKGVLQRSKELSDEGRTLEARALIEEWSELQSKYQAQAYGRVPPPVSAEATPR
jgi:hypothetical protein